MTAHPDYGEETRPVSFTAQNIFYEGNRTSPADIVAKQFPDMGMTSAEKKQMADFIAGLLESRKNTIQRDGSTRSFGVPRSWRKDNPSTYSLRYFKNLSPG